MSIIGPETVCEIPRMLPGPRQRFGLEINTLDDGSILQFKIMQKSSSEVLQKGSRTDLGSLGKSQKWQVASLTTDYGLARKHLSIDGIHRGYFLYVKFCPHVLGCKISVECVKWEKALESLQNEYLKN